MIWAIANIASGLIASAGIVYLLTAYRERFHAFERFTMLMIASAMVLRVGPILGKNMKVVSPFDDWSTSLLHLGIAGYVAFKIYKLEYRRRHA